MPCNYTDRQLIKLPPIVLTQRQSGVLRLRARGYFALEIAEILKLTSKQVNCCLNSLRDKGILEKKG